MLKRKYERRTEWPADPCEHRLDIPRHRLAPWAFAAIYGAGCGFLVGVICMAVVVIGSL